MFDAVEVTLRGVSSRYEDGPRVVDDLSFRLPAGGFHSIIGPSGCGKSTLLRLVAGLLSPDSGEVLVNGGDPRRNRSRETGFVFQEPTLMPWLNVRDNIALPLRLGGVAKGVRSERAAELAAGFGLGDFLDYYPRQLSGGMKMRVSMARALAKAPGLMLFDEPFAGLDAIRRDRMGEELLEVWARDGWTGLFVTHNVAEAVFLSQRVYVMGGRPGHIADAYDVNLPYPRKTSIRTGAQFQQIVSVISDGLRRVAAV